MRVHLCKTLPLPWYFPLSPTSSPWVLILVPFKKGCCCHLTSEYRRPSERVAWPRSHSIIKAGTGTSYSSTSCLASLGTEGGDQFDSFDSSFLEVRTMWGFFFEKSILSFSIPIFHWDKFFILLPTNLTSCQPSISNSFNPFHSVLEAISTQDWHVIWYTYVI